jgi:hypothetical protein
MITAAAIKLPRIFAGYFTISPLVFILFDLPIGAVGLSIEQGAGLVRLILRRPGERRDPYAAAHQQGDGASCLCNN